MVEDALEIHPVPLAGDSLRADIAGGRRFGYRTALVLTGLTRRSMLDGARPAPQEVFQGL